MILFLSNMLVWELEGDLEFYEIEEECKWDLGRATSL